MSLVKITKMDLYKIQIVLEVLFQRVKVENYVAT
jgi:hypothetical protein